MKKLLLSILTFIYMAVSSGIAMEIHYCMGKEAGVDYYNYEDKKKCGKCGMKEKKGGCCSDEHRFYKLEDSHKQVSNDISFYAGDIAIAEPVTSYDPVLPAAAEYLTVPIHGPPDIHGPSLRVLNCIFRI